MSSWLGYEYCIDDVQIEKPSILKRVCRWGYQRCCSSLLIANVDHPRGKKFTWPNTNKRPCLALAGHDSCAVTPCPYWGLQAVWFAVDLGTYTGHLSSNPIATSSTLQQFLELTHHRHIGTPDCAAYKRSATSTLTGNPNRPTGN